MTLNSFWKSWVLEAHCATSPAGVRDNSDLWHRHFLLWFEEACPPPHPGWVDTIYHGAILTDLTTWALTPPFVYVREECHAFKLLLDSKAVSFLILSLLKKLCLFITQCSCASCSAIPWFFKQHPSFVAGVLVTSAFYPGCTYLWACIWDWFLSNLFHHSLGLPCCHCSSSSVFHPFLLFTS